MNIVIDALNWISSLGPMIMMPIIILILGLFFRIKLNTLLKSALTVGIGFAGVNIIINWFISQVGPSVQLMVKIGVFKQVLWMSAGQLVQQPLGLFL